MTAWKDSILSLIIVVALVASAVTYVSGEQIQADQVGAKQYIVHSGTVTFDFSREALDEIGIQLAA